MSTDSANRGQEIPTQEAISVLDAIYTTRAIRKFRPEPVPTDLIMKVLEAATQAPSGMNNQPWRFLVVTDPQTKLAIGELYRQSYVSLPQRIATQPDENKNPSLYLANRMGEAPVLILVCGPQRRQPAPGGLTMAGPASIFPAVQNLLLAARTFGLGGVLTVNHEPRMEEIRALVNIPEDYYAYALVPLGFAAQRHGPKSRRPVGEVTFFDSWGNSLPSES